MKKIAFIVHGKIRNRERLFSEIAETFKDNYSLNFYITQKAGDGIAQASVAIREGCTYLIAIGGDGTMNEVANAVMQSNTDTQNIFVGLLPRGTGNDFARTIKVNANIGELKALIDEGKHTTTDLGMVSFTNMDSKKSGRYFINITDVGLGGTIIEKLSHSSKLFGATLTYQYAIISTLIGYARPLIKAVADSFTYEGRVLNFVIANGQYIGGGMGIAPEALINDGRFAIVIAGNLSLFDYLKNLPGIRKRLKIVHPEVQYKTAREVSVESLAKPIPIDMDGEFIGYTPFSVKVVPGVIKVLCP